MVGLKVIQYEALLYIFNEVLWKIKVYTEQLLKEEMALFRQASIERSLNGAVFLNATTTDLEVRLLKENVHKLGLYLQMDGFIKGGTKTFNVELNLLIELNRYRYTIGENRNVAIWQEYLYHHHWTEDELKQTSEKWSEIIIDEIAKGAEQVI